MMAWRFFPILLLTACTGAEGEAYLGRPGSPAWFATASTTTQVNYFVQRCQAYGFVAGTPEMAQCVQNESGNSRAAAAVRSAAISNNMAIAGATMQQNAAIQQQNAIATMNANRIRTTTCTPMGSNVRCTTF